MRFFILVFLILISCEANQQPQPRPHQYPKIIFPERDYKTYSNQECPFEFQIPAYSDVTQKRLFFDEVQANPCWFDLDLKIFDATVHCSYYSIGGDRSFDKLVDDAFTLASKHNIKASFREEYIVRNKHGASGLIFKISGPVATPYQFYMTDSINHFLRGSLYFNDHAEIDSIQPLIEFIEVEIEHMLNTLNWLD